MAMANLLASSSSNSSANSNSPYDVFVNHRGPDTKSSIATHIYSSLTPHNLRVFQDKEEMEKGDFITSQISAAIREASVHIPIFSPRYAESEWCLNELLLMLESMESRRSTVIPVFYGVKPADLRRPVGENGLYAEALRRLQLETKTTDSKTHQEKPRYDCDAIEKWRDALCKVSYISGFEYDAGVEADGNLVEDLVKVVLQKVKRPLLHVSRYPTGLDKKVKVFEELLQQQSGETRVFGIVGLGGVGKTTLAKEIFNRV